MLGLLGVLINFISIVVAGLLAGLLGSLTGLGGGTVLVPLLSLFYGVPIILATGASLISTIATSAGSASAYTKQKIANIKIGIGLEMATTTGAVVGSFTLYFIDKTNLLWVIFLAFGSVLLFSMIPTIRRSMPELPKHIPPDWTTRVFQLSGSYYDSRLRKTVEYHGVRWYYGEIVMFFAGFISGLLGIGSGALKVMGMDWAMNLPMKVTTTTSNFMIGITAATGSSIYWRLGYIQPFLASATAIGVVLGSYFGAKLLMRLTNKEIRWVFFAILSFLGWDMVFRGIAYSNVVVISIFIQTVYAVILSITVIVLAFYWIRTVRKHERLG